MTSASIVFGSGRRTIVKAQGSWRTRRESVPLVIESAPVPISRADAK
jgi:hypothetical protein